MKKSILTLAILLGAFCFSWSQSHGEIQVANETPSSTTYQFRLVKLDSPVAADRLEDALEAKEGILSADASIISKICTVEVVKAVKPNNIADVVSLYGYEIAKSFKEQ